MLYIKCMYFFFFEGRRPIAHISFSNGSMNYYWPREMKGQEREVDEIGGHTHPWMEGATSMNLRHSGLGDGGEPRKKRQRRESLLKWRLRESSQLTVGVGWEWGWRFSSVTTVAQRRLGEWMDGQAAQPSSWRLENWWGQLQMGGWGQFRKPDCVSGELWRDRVEKFFQFSWCDRRKKTVSQWTLYSVHCLKYSWLCG